MKILLVDPPFYRFIKYYNRYFPLGLAYLAEVLRKQGHETLIYDADANVERAREMDFSVLENKYEDYLRQVSTLNHPIWNEFRMVLSDFKPYIVGISIFTTKVAGAFRAAEIVKSLNASIPVVIGGPHPSVRAEESLRICPHVDFAIRGEGEISFLRLIEAIEKQTSYHKVDGLSYRSNGRIIHNQQSDFIPNLDEIGFPERNLLFHKSAYTSEDMGLIMTGRGCPFGCTFCSSVGVWRRIARFRSVKNVLAEIKQVQKDFGCVQFAFKDDTFTLKRDRVLELCREIKAAGLNIKWDCNARANLLDETLLKEMKSAGCNGIKMGIESGSERIRQDIMNKGVTTEQIKNAARLIRKAGIHWTGYFMMGLPTETKEEMHQTLSLMRDIKPDFASLSVYEPFPGTALYDENLQENLFAKSRELNDYYSISPKYYYLNDGEIHSDTMSNEEFKKIEAFMKKSFHKHNLRLSGLLKRGKARSMLYLKNPLVLVEDVRKFIAWIS